MDTELATLTPATEPNADRYAALLVAWSEAQRSENTRTEYARDISRYLAWLDTHGFDMLAVKRPAIDAYRNSLAGANSTVNRRIAAISSLYRYAISADLLENNPAAYVARLKVSNESTTKGLSNAQAKRLLDAAKDYSPRAYALVTLLLTDGLRVSEALNADTKDYGHDQGHRVLWITRKGGKRQQVAVPPRAQVALDAYLGITGTDLAVATDSHPIFTTRTGTRWSRVEAFKTIRRLALRLGIDDISPHSLRHTYATEALKSGTPLRELQRSMGHSSPDTTIRYDRSQADLNKSPAYTVARAFG